MTEEKQSGLSSIFGVTCSLCGHINEVKSSGEHRAGTRGPPVSDINTRATLGSLHAGIGNTHLNNLLSRMNIPTVNHRMFKRREREIGNVVEKVARESCKLNLNLEKAMAKQSSVPSTDDLVGNAVSYDMAWQKRGRGHNSASTGHGAAMGLAAGKVVSYSTRCKSCRVCTNNRLTGRKKKHDCRRNHSGSSKSMERDVACELWGKAPQYGVKFSIYVRDDDTTILADIKNKVPYGVEKWSDVVHAKRSLNSRLYNLRDRFKGSNCAILSQKVKHYLTKCFSYCVSQHAGDSKSLKQGLKCIIPHAFGEHASCNVSWCGYKQNPTAYKHTDLPNGKDLSGDSLKKALTDIFDEYSTDIVVNKLTPCANSQRNESLNSTIGAKNPKTRFYGGSESSDFRVAYGVAQTNIGYNYTGKTLEVLNIEPGFYHNKHVKAMDKKVDYDNKRKMTKEFKSRRNQLSKQKTS